MASDPGSSDVQLVQQVGEALREHHAERAARLAEAALERGIRHPLLFMARGLWLTEQKRHADALTQFQAAQEISEPTAPLENALGLCLAQLGRYEEAVDAFDLAISLQPASAQFHYRKGWVHELAENLNLAWEAHQQAIALKPDYADALGRLAFLAARRGAMPEAEAYAKRALATAPGQTPAQLASAMAELERRDYGPASVRLNALIDDKRVQGTDRFIAYGLLGDLSDRLDRTEEAFTYYGLANQVAATMRPAARAGGPTMLGLVQGLIDTMENIDTVPQSGEAPAEALGGAAGHAFIIGFPRSGTTLLEQMLACHGGIVTLEEKDTLIEALRAFIPESGDLTRLWSADAGVIAFHRRRYWERVRGFGADPMGKFFIDKTPINTIYLPLLMRLFPDAKFLFALRDPRDVVLSCFRRRFTVNPLTSEFLTLESTARFYDAVMHLFGLYRAKLSPPLYRVQHEALVGHFDGEAARICEFLGLPFDGAMREFAQRSATRGVATPSSTQLVRGLNSEAIGQWRRYADRLAPVLPVLQPWAARFGYPPD